MTEKKSEPTGDLRQLAERYEWDTMLRSGPCEGSPHFNQYASEQVGKVVLAQRKKVLGGLIDANSSLADLKSDDIKDQGLRRLEKPIKRKRSRVYKMS